MRQIPILPGFAAAVLTTRGDPCDGCPLNDGKRQKVPPTVPQRPILGVVGLGSGLEETVVLGPFVGEGGRFLRKELNDAGIPAGMVEYPKDPALRVAFANLTRCRPDDNAFDGKPWQRAADHCWSYLRRDLEGSYPLLLLGAQPAQRFLRDKGIKAGAARGLWHRAPDGRDVFVTWHPVYVSREISLRGQECKVARQFRADLRTLAARLNGTAQERPTVQVRIYRSLVEAVPFLDWLAAGTPAGRWFFDVETFDAQQVPSRRDVATDPFHPDFRLRGVAIAIGPWSGAWVELADWEERKAEAAVLLEPAFASEDEKGAFVGGFDEDALVVPGWVPMIRNRARDPWLAAIALDASGMGHALDRLAVEVLGEPQPKVGVDRGRIREMPLEVVAEYAVNDACLEWRLDEALQRRLDAGEHL